MISNQAITQSSTGVAYSGPLPVPNTLDVSVSEGPYAPQHDQRLADGPRAGRKE
jgi:hypothetical protein